MSAESELISEGRLGGLARSSGQGHARSRAQATDGADGLELPLEPRPLELGLPESGVQHAQLLCKVSRPMPLWHQLADVERRVDERREMVRNCEERKTVGRVALGPPAPRVCARVASQTKGRPAHQKWTGHGDLRSGRAQASAMGPRSCRAAQAGAAVRRSVSSCPAELVPRLVLLVAEAAAVPLRRARPRSVGQPS
jgi:hypothetical protein